MQDYLDPLGHELKDIYVKSKAKVLRLPKEIYKKSSTKAMLRLTKSILLVVVGYLLLSQLPWFLLPLGWILTGTAFAGLLAIGYACRSGDFFNHPFINHVVGQICLIPLMIPFESWHAFYTKEKESLKAKVTSYLSCSHFWWCTSVWNSLTSNLDAYPSLFSSGKPCKKRLIGNLFLLYLFCALFFPLMTYNLGLWGLAKYYLIPLVVYHFWASSFFKTSSLFEMLEIDADSDLITLAYYKYPKWVEFLAGELNYAFSSLQKLTTQEEDFVDDKTSGDAVDENSTSTDATKRQNDTELPSLSIPFYNIKDAFNLIKEQNDKIKKTVEIKFREMSFISLLNSRTGDLNELQAKVKDVIAEQLSNIEWITTIYLFLTPVISVYGLITCEYYWQTFVLCFFHYLTGGLGITAGYHRLYSHRAYKAHPIFKNILLFFATGCFQMSVLEWCNDHRAHHRYTDTNKDPYTVSKGFWWAHMGWLLVKREEPVVSDISDLEKESVLQFQHKYYPWLALSIGFVLPTVIAGVFWGDWWGGFLIAGVLSRVVVQHATFCVNSVAHYFGSLTFSDQRSPRDSWLVGLITFGEGYHNFHHEFPYDYRNGEHKRAFDPTKWIIWALSFFGITYDLMLFDKQTIAKGKLIMKEKALAIERAALHWGPPEETLPSYTMEKVTELCAKGEQLMVFEGYVHDVTAFSEKHPGGSKFIKANIGRDVAKQFNGSVYNHSLAARNIIQTLRIAKLVPKEHAE